MAVIAIATALAAVVVGTKVDAISVGSTGVMPPVGNVVLLLV